LERVEEMGHYPAVPQTVKRTAKPCEAIWIQNGSHYSNGASVICDLGSINRNAQRTPLEFGYDHSTVGRFVVFVPSLSQMRSPKVMSQVMKVNIR
jgi:hypothetical protein